MGWTIRVSFSAGSVVGFFLCPPTVSYPVGTEGSYPGGKVARV